MSLKCFHLICLTRHIKKLFQVRRCGAEEQRTAAERPPGSICFHRQNPTYHSDRRLVFKPRDTRKRDNLSMLL